MKKEYPYKTKVKEKEQEERDEKWQTSSDRAKGEAFHAAQDHRHCMHHAENGRTNVKEERRRASRTKRIILV